MEIQIAIWTPDETHSSVRSCGNPYSNDNNSTTSSSSVEHARPRATQRRQGSCSSGKVVGAAELRCGGARARRRCRRAGAPYWNVSKGGYYEAGAAGSSGGPSIRRGGAKAACRRGLFERITLYVRCSRHADSTPARGWAAAVLLSGKRTCQCQPLKVCRQANSMALSSTARSARSRWLIFFRVPP